MVVPNSKQLNVFSNQTKAIKRAMPLPASSSSNIRTGGREDLTFQTSFLDIPGQLLPLYMHFIK